MKASRRNYPFYILNLLCFRLLCLFYFSTLSGCRPLTLAPLTAHLIYYTIRRSVTFRRTISRILVLGSIFRAMSEIMLRPVNSASEPMVLAPCHRKGHTNERHSPPKKLPIPWPHCRKGGWLYGTYTVMATISAFLMLIVPY